MSPYRYRTFGLGIASDRPIAALAPGDPDASEAAEIKIFRGEVHVPKEIEEIDYIGVFVDGDDYYLSIPECGRFRITGGHTIIIQPDPRASPDQIDLYLLGTVFGVLLHQRGLLPFHCSAVEAEGLAFLFCGDSGAGKSTLAAHLSGQGLQLLGDDVCALNVKSGSRVIAVGGPSRLRLWQDTLQQFGQDSSGLSLIPGYDDKYELRLTQESVPESFPVGAIYHLRRAGGERPAGIWPLRGLEAVNTVTTNIYRRRFADRVGAAPNYLSATRQIVDRVSIFTMNRKWSFGHFDEEARALVTHLRRIVDQFAAFRS